jgi:hypothetical protein
MNPGGLPKVFSGSTAASAWTTALLTLYCGAAFATSLARHLDRMSIGLTGLGMIMFAAMTALNLRAQHTERRLQSEYSFTASRHISKPVRSP